VNERTATFALEALDKDRIAVGTSVQIIMHVLHDYIPRAVRCEAQAKLFDALFINGIELTGNMMRKEYEQWKRVELDGLMAKANPIFKVQS